MKIRVLLFRIPDRSPFYQAKWQDPVTGKWKRKSTKQKTRREAERFAAGLEHTLREGKSLDLMPWSDFRAEYESRKVIELAPTSRDKIRISLNLVESIIQPATVQAINEREVSRFAAELRKPYKTKFGKERPGRSPSTVRGKLVDLQTALRWGVRQRIIDRVPEIDLPKRLNATESRPLTGEEFERMLALIPEVCGKAAAPSWKFLVEGIYWSSLRIGETVKLSWDQDTGFNVDFSGRFPMFRIRATAEKGKQDRLMPMAPEFAQMLEAVPKSQRRGRVFKPLPTRNQKASTSGTVNLDWRKKIIAKLGKKANVVLKEYADGRPSFASAHDLRKAFGFRWSLRVMPPVLKEMMRHQDIQTTMKYYVGRNAQVTASAVWTAWEHSQPIEPTNQQERIAE